MSWPDGEHIFLRNASIKIEGLVALNRGFYAQQIAQKMPSAVPAN